MSVKLLGLVAVLGLAASVAQGGEPVDFEGSAWSTTGQMKARFDSLKDVLEVDVTLELGPAEGLLADQFRLTVDDGFEPVEIVGVYQLPKPGKPLFEMSDEELIDALGLYEELEEFGFKLKSKLKAKAKLVDGVETVKVKFKMKAKLSIGIEPFTESVSMAFSYKGEGGRVE